MRGSERERERMGRGRASDGDTGNMQQPLNLEGRNSKGSSAIQRLLAKCRGNGIRAKAACACSGGGREAVNGPAAENNVRIISETGTDGKLSERVGGVSKRTC